jgi:hypothetical protein
MKNDPKDGIEYINIYSAGKTPLGRMLSNFYYSPFITEDGEFNSVEGYWYWLLSPGDDSVPSEKFLLREELRIHYGLQAKVKGKLLSNKDWDDSEEFKNKIKKAIRAKIETNPDIYMAFISSSLPFKHHYVYGDRVTPVKQAEWLVEHFTTLRTELQENYNNSSFMGSWIITGCEHCGRISEECKGECRVRF